VDVLRAKVPNVNIRWLYFSHNVKDCEANVRRRAHATVQRDLRQLFIYSACYRIPPGAEERPCYCMRSGADERAIRG
jgi:hypothetical protein